MAQDFIPQNDQALLAWADNYSTLISANPTEQGDWKFEGNVTRTSMDIVFPPATAPGAKVWFTAFWFNPRLQAGPAATPVSTNIPGGGAMAA
jgi:hypothetical protein